MSVIIDWLFPKKCLGCDKGERYLCSLCEKGLTTGGIGKRKGFEGIISIYKYNGMIRKVIERIKYEFVEDAGKELGELMVKKLLIDYPNVVKYWKKGKYILMPIPLYWQRKNWRGFNQSETLAKTIAAMLDLGYRDDLLIRNKNSVNQAKIKNKSEREKNVEGVFVVKKTAKIPRKIVLVDDVITSGATIGSALSSLGKSRKGLDWALSLAGALK